MMVVMVFRVILLVLNIFVIEGNFILILLLFLFLLCYNLDLVS